MKLVTSSNCQDSGDLKHAALRQGKKDHLPLSDNTKCINTKCKNPATQWCKKATVFAGSCKQGANSSGRFAFFQAIKRDSTFLLIINHVRCLSRRLRKENKDPGELWGLEEEGAAVDMQRKVFSPPTSRQPAVPLHQQACNFPSKVCL